MTTVFHAWQYGRFKDIQSKLRKKKLHRTNQGSNFLGGSFRNNERAQSNLEEKVNPSIFKDDFSSKRDPSIVTSITPVLLDWSSETIWVFPAMKSTGHSLPQSTVSCRSDWSSEANFSCWDRSNAWSHLRLESSWKL